ncbi:hypothetical protein CERSUDRAFT_118207 [Gelatoporia subvermispora B]|uniref:Trafficking protein particle complex subunit 11 domain-containing protein n=1 Tax=Ceriporiopsis subvermispora (strain B) TaxID=914234 RepID=M2PBY6_CERS8|nr:hypothetical protein CERSUDRAFT_118207 [Gelatoporia subvermispora B]
MFVAGLEDLSQPPPPQSPTQSAAPQDPFAALSVRLREVLLAQRKAAIWQPEKNRTFKVLLADKDMRFPPRKVEDLQTRTFHSPLSPLMPSSPMYPDGLISPFWIRKHTTLVPAVFVIFMRIYESPVQAPRSPLDVPDADREREREAEERRRDTELAADIAQRKKHMNDYGVKLTVVLLASRRMLDDPALDNRLTFIRRQSGLDPRAALFVLSPVSQAEIGDFVRSLQDALYEPAVEYYTNHSKRVRRKRNKHSQTVSSYPLPMSPIGAAAATPRPLRPEGWTVRYEYKMACFAEFRGEDEIALKHYQDAYSSLLIMFGSTAILPPRTKRWSEARVLADCINVKICKLYLYNNEHSLALAHHNSHIRRFADFSRGWGMGEETFEYWAWLARQYRILAELLEEGTKSTLKIPSHFRTPSQTAALVAAHALESSASQRNLLEAEALRLLGLNPTQALQHPGFYYYMAARCQERRRERFLKALESETAATLPAYGTEKKVDHLAVIVELYTKAHDHFKQFRATGAHGHDRFILWIVNRIAETYCMQRKYQVAVRFFERIARTYRGEGWNSLLLPLLTMWYRCAQQLGDMELSVRLLVEMLSHGEEYNRSDPEVMQEDLLAVLKSTVPSSTDESLVIDSSESEPILESCVVFWKPDVNVGETIPFQILLTAPSGVSMSAIPFTTLSVEFSADVPPLVIQHSAEHSDEVLPQVRTIDLGHIAIPSSDSEEEEEPRIIGGVLRWAPGSTVVLSGTLLSDTPTTVSVVKLHLVLQEGSWTIELPLRPAKHRQQPHTLPRWLVSAQPPRFMPIRHDNYSELRVHHRPHKVYVSVTHHAPAYLGEEYPITVEVCNTDERELDMIMDVLLQPSEFDEAVNHISLDDQKSSSLVKGIPLGVLPPGASLLKTIYLFNDGIAGDRTLDISVQSRSTATPEPSSPASPNLSAEASLVDKSETLQTLTVGAVEAFKVEHDITYRRALGPQAGPSDLRAFSAEHWDDREGGEAVIASKFACAGPSSVVVESIKLVREDGVCAKVVNSSVEDDEDVLAEWLPGDEFCGSCCVSLAPEDDHQEDQDTPGPGAYEITWRRIISSGDRGSLSTSHFTLPPLRPPTDGLVALLDTPPMATLHEPITIRMTVRNGHPSRSANVTVHLEPDSADGFVVAGLRSGRVPILLPGAEEQVLWKLIPIECGYVKVPRIRVLDRRRAVEQAQLQGAQGPLPNNESEADVVHIVDVRWDVKGTSAQGEGNRTSLDGPASGGEPIILVVP